MNTDLKYFSILTVLAGLFIFSSCSKDDSQTCTASDFIGRYRLFVPDSACETGMKITQQTINASTLSNCELVLMSSGNSEMFSFNGNELELAFSQSGVITQKCTYEKLYFSCDCAGMDYDPSIAYKPFSVVLSNGKCYESKDDIQGGALPAFSNFWELCFE